MEQFLPYTAWITSKTAFYLNWLNEHVVVWSTLVQAAIILAIWLAERKEKRSEVENTNSPGNGVETIDKQA